jgi:hypothetical protein
MALLPPIPDRPADRPETWAEYLSRRAIVAMHRQFADELAAWVVDAPPFTVDDVVKSFGRFAEAYRFKPKPVFIDEDVTWREDGVRRLLAYPSVTDLFFTDVLTDADAVVTPAETQWPAGSTLKIADVVRFPDGLKEVAGADGSNIVTRSPIDLAQEVIPPAEARWIDEEIERLGPICEAADHTRK